MALTSKEKQDRFQKKQARLGRKELRSQYLDPAETAVVMKLITKLKKKRPPDPKQ